MIALRFFLRLLLEASNNACFIFCVLIINTPFVRVQFISRPELYNK